ncbi:maltooligosyl trehalose hydrolase [Larkinella arboricola]|uniref:Malto-oligosyltrehalose trehalohydrolase n=1 Tax=Larkinella arboricola TaxID=643671 RepID=A0A327WP73_LARAB|nr:malto-oligosyltrehalose trehalohydrolase [Larkinella arboricola]RAJ92478.1 maltooligosyl trehalose hydrolase [Larkinella arboricola]
MKTIGANYTGDGRCIFTVWAPEKKSMTLLLLDPSEREILMDRGKWGYFSVELTDIKPGTRYYFKPDGGKPYPDPASHFQPEGIHGPSAVVDQGAHTWQDQSWRGLSFQDLILYELHVGTFTPEGTFEAIIPRLDDLAATGINALELMPIAQFPGVRNWGYDGVYLYSVQDSYGGPAGLKKLVDACHARGMAVFLDVVYNHLGPEGNYFDQFGPYFTEKYCTPWGNAINFDEEWADGVRDYISNNPLHWFEHYHIDGLRFDAIHEVFDMGAVSIWELIHTTVKVLERRLGRSLHLVAESDLNSPKVIKTPEAGGLGFDAQWLDDFHHALYVLLDKAGRDRYADFGRMEQLAKALTDGFVMSGEYTTFRKRKFGASSAGIPGDRFVAFNLNHDQVGNRVSGERLCHLIDFERQKLAAAVLLLSPYVPMLFMGEEYADESPFFYFVDHSDADLIHAVKEGRKQEFAAFSSDTEPQDPFEIETFTKSRIQWEKRTEGKHRIILEWHRKLIELRRTEAVLKNVAKNDIRVTVLGQAGLVVHRQSVGGYDYLIGLYNFSDEEVSYELPGWVLGWTKLLDSKEPQWMENGDDSSTLLPAQAKPGQVVTLPPCSVTVYAGQVQLPVDAPV